MGIKIRAVKPGESVDKTRIQLQKGDQAGWISFADPAAAQPARRERARPQIFEETRQLNKNTDRCLRVFTHPCPPRRTRRHPVTASTAARRSTVQRLPRLRGRCLVNRQKRRRGRRFILYINICEALAPIDREFFRASCRVKSLGYLDSGEQIQRPLEARKPTPLRPLASPLASPRASPPRPRARREGWPRRPRRGSRPRPASGPRC